MSEARIIRGVVTAGKYTPVAQLTLDGRTGETFKDRFYVQHYGFASRPKAGAEALIYAHGNTAFVIATEDRNYRLALDADGEVALYTDEGDYVKLGRNKIITVKGGEKVVVDTKAAEIKATTEAVVDSPSIKLGSSGASKTLMFYEDFADIWNAHTLPVSGATAGPPSTPLPASVATTKVKAE